MTIPAQPLRALVCLLGVVLLCSVGCAPVSIRGTVIEGEISLIAVVDKSDPRLNQPGLGDAVVVVQQTGRSGAVVERDARGDGRFYVPLKGTGALSAPMGVEVRAPGYVRAIEESMPTPTKDQRLLVLLKPIGRLEP
ncbi:MAG: hypothetical protein ACTS22_04930 [Phycisphaerales bacterium]